MTSQLHGKTNIFALITCILISFLLAACAAPAPAQVPTTTPTRVPPTATPEPTPDPAQIAAGKAAFVRIGCVACHTITGLSESQAAPNLDHAYDLAMEVLKSPEYKKSQGIAKTPRDFLIESILYPDNFTYPNCPQGPCVKGTMPTNYKDIVRPEELKAIVEYLMSLRR